MFMETKYGGGVLTQKFTVAIKRLDREGMGKSLQSSPATSFAIWFLH